MTVLNVKVSKAKWEPALSCAESTSRAGGAKERPSGQCGRQPPVLGPDSPPASPPLPGLAYLPPSSLPGESARGEAGLDGGRTMRLARPARRRRGSLHLLREANGPRRARTGPGTSAGLGVGNTPRRTQKASGSPAPTAGVLPPYGQPGALQPPDTASPASSPPPGQAGFA